MTAYWCSRVHVTDAETYAKNAELAGPAIEKHGGVFLARGGKQVILEGGAFERSVVARFPSLEAAERCYHSPEYSAARKFTIGTAERHMVAVEGWTDPSPDTKERADGEPGSSAREPSPQIPLA